jgi:hypothetical protein
MSVFPWEQHLVVAISKHVFLNKESNVVSVEHPINLSGARKYGLSPTILYGLLVFKTPIFWLTFSPVESPKSIREVLFEGWTKAKALLGCPSYLKINRHLAAACPGLKEDLAKINVKLLVAEPQDRDHPASLRTAQLNSTFCLISSKSDKQSWIDSLESLCQFNLSAHNNSAGTEDLSGYPTEYQEFVRDRPNLYNQNQPPPVATWSSATGVMDWAPGAWMASWEKTLPQNQRYHFSLNERTGRLELLPNRRVSI